MREHSEASQHLLRLHLTPYRLLLSPEASRHLLRLHLTPYRLLLSPEASRHLLRLLDKLPQGLANLANEVYDEMVTGKPNSTAKSLGFLAMSPHSDIDSLYDRLGGASKIESLVVAFYNRVLSDPELSPFFAHVDVDKLHKMQTEFFTAALGGPQKYSGRTIAAVHHGRGIQRKHFSAFCQHLFQIMEEMGVNDQDINATVGRIALSVRDVTGEPTVDG